MKLRDVCVRTGVSKRNIHFYIKEEILCPEQDEDNGYYIFSEEDCCRLMFIRSLRNAGFSIAQIRSILNKPSTAGYYLNLRLKELKAEVTHSEAIIEALSYVQERLPIHVRYNQFESLVKKAGIPLQVDFRDSTSMAFEEYDNDLVNRYLWESFLPDEPMTDYQEYLWSKVIRYSNGDHSRDYQLLSQSLHQLSSEEIEQAFSDNKELYFEVIRLSPEDYDSYAKQMICRIEIFLKRPDLVTSWKRKYLNLIAPATRLYDSEIAATMDELSPLFLAYRKNIHSVCEKAYDWITSDKGENMLNMMSLSLGSCYDIDHCSHGELQAMAVERG